MSLVIQNRTGSLLSINDLGFALDANDELNLANEVSAHEVSRSAAGGDLEELINNGSVVVKDPIDGVTNLSIQNGLLILRNHNTPNFGLPVGSKIADADDVDLSGSGNYLFFDGSILSRTDVSGLAKDISESNSLDHGDLAGLLDDHHPQYVKKAGDLMSGELIMKTSNSGIVLQQNAGIDGSNGGQWKSNKGSIERPAISIGEINTGLYSIDDNVMGFIAGGNRSSEPQIVLDGTANNNTEKKITFNSQVYIPDKNNTVDDSNTSPPVNFLHTSDDGKILSSPLSAIKSGGGQGQILRPTFVIFAEENSSISVGSTNYEFSFGNGATNTSNDPSGIPVGVKCALIAITFSADNASRGTSSASISVVNNGKVVATSGVAKVFGLRTQGKIATQVQPDTVIFEIGDTLQFLTASTSGAWSRVRVSAWFERIE